MAFSFSFSHSQKRTPAIVLDIGARSTKALHVQRQEETLELFNFTIQETPAPTADKPLNAESLAGHFRQVAEQLGAKTKRVVLVAGVNDAFLRPAELPMMPVSDMRAMLKFNGKNYLQQDLSDHLLDCHILPPRPGSGAAEPGKLAKCRTLVGATKRQWLDQMQDAAKGAGLVTDFITLNLIGTANAFELAQPELFAKEVVALVDIGLKTTTISILLQGELSLSRVVNLGGDKLTNGLAEWMGLSYAEAENVKRSMTNEANAVLSTLLPALGQELRASINFFEKQEDKTVSRVFISGGSACSPFIVESLQTELMIPCQTWNPLSPFRLSLPPAKLGELEAVAPQFAVAAGGALAAL